MVLSVAYTFEPEIIPRLAQFPNVREIYGKLDRDIVGGGRSTYTLRPTTRSSLVRSVVEAHRFSIRFNYLLNAATLGGIEQTRRGQKRIRALLDFLDETGVDSLTVASPYLLRLIKAQYPRFKVRAGAFAMIDSPAKARQWEDMGADTLCLSAIACNRDLRKLRTIRTSVGCEVQLIANASCLPRCAYEPTHMNLLSNSSRTGDRLRGYCLDYCILHCSEKRLSDPANYLRSTWIRPEDLHIYEEIGINSFKLVERSCPGDLLIRRVQAYVNRRFEGNLLEIAGPVAQIKKEQNTPLRQRVRMVLLQFRPGQVKLSTLRAMKRYGEKIILHEFDRARAPVYIDNRLLDGFLDGMLKRECDPGDCKECGYCRQWMEKAVRIDPAYREEVLSMARGLDNGLVRSTHWLPGRDQRT